MAVLKCKMCGGDMELSADKTFGTCEFCGSSMTLPKIDNDQRAATFNRGNQFRRAGEFDKALSLYEHIVEEDDTDAEAHWCCVLCRFGIEYVEDPETLEYVPTCHRASFDSILEDVDYKAALEHSEGLTKRQYMKDAAKIAEVQKGILATSQNEEPFDVFISYKETDDNGSRTVDATLAQDIYYRLTEKGYRVFFSRITLEGKAGTEYEPYIFAALNSSKVMVLVGTSAENMNSVWVKNEWSRFLAMRKKDRNKILIPCYRDMDPYDLPEQISVLKAYDMSQIGFIQDLIHGIEKVVDEDKPVVMVKETAVVNTQMTPNIVPLLKRVFIFLEDEEWEEAEDYCEKVLDIDPECADAYLGKLMADNCSKKKEDLKNCESPFDDDNNYQKVLRYGRPELAAELKGYISFINERNENARVTDIYNKALNIMNAAKNENAYRDAASGFESIKGFKDADALAEECINKAEISRKQKAYSSAKFKMMTKSYEEAIDIFRTIIGYKDVDEQLDTCQEKISELQERKEAERIEAEKTRIAEELAEEKRRKIAIILIVVGVINIILAFISEAFISDSGIFGYIGVIAFVYGFHLLSQYYKYPTK